MTNDKLYSFEQKPKSAQKGWIIQNKVSISHRVNHYPSYPNEIKVN